MVDLQETSFAQKYGLAQELHKYIKELNNRLEHVPAVFISFIFGHISN